MIWRILFALISLTALGALLYVRQSDSASDVSTVQALPAELGYVATDGDLVETGEDGHPLYRLDAERIEQPSPQGLIYLTAPRLIYQIAPDDHWTLTALRGQLPQDAQYADLSGTVHAEGHPSGSASLMHIDTEILHLDMPQQIATSPSKVATWWNGMTLTGVGMRYEMKRNALELQSDFHGASGLIPPQPAASAPASATDAPAVDYKALLQACHAALCLYGPHLDITLTHMTSPDITIVSTARATVVKGDLGEGDISGADSKNSNWVVTGNVQIFMPQGHLKADRASVKIVNDRATILSAQGMPAEFERFPDSALPTGLSSKAQAALEHARGHAREIIFDVERNQLELSGDAFITTGCREFRADHIVYDLTAQGLKADTRDGSKVQVNILRDSSTCAPDSGKP
jgi:LPS export ABC transporter protein LptC/lipopolysaccharide transport protein LptA